MSSSNGISIRSNVADREVFILKGVNQFADSVGYGGYFTLRNCVIVIPPRFKRANIRRLFLWKDNWRYTSVYGASDLHGSVSVQLTILDVDGYWCVTFEVLTPRNEPVDISTLMRGAPKSNARLVVRNFERSEAPPDEVDW